MSKKYKNYSITLLMADGKEHIIPFAVPMGEDGAKGDPGKSAYEIAVDYGFKGTEAEWLDSLKYGKDGESAYQIAVEYGFQGTETEWLASLKGEKGERGEQGLKGADGANGQNGADGKDGANGKDGKDGNDGVSVTEVKQIQTSNADGGTNIIQVKLSNEQTFQFQVKNGSKGSTPIIDTSNFATLSGYNTFSNSIVAPEFTTTMNDEYRCATYYPNHIYYLDDSEGMGYRSELIFPISEVGTIATREWVQANAPFVDTSDFLPIKEPTAYDQFVLKNDENIIHFYPDGFFQIEMYGNEGHNAWYGFAEDEIVDDVGGTFATREWVQANAGGGLKLTYLGDFVVETPNIDPSMYIGFMFTIGIDYDWGMAFDIVKSGMVFFEDLTWYGYGGGVYFPFTTSDLYERGVTIDPYGNGGNANEKVVLQLSPNAESGAYEIVFNPFTHASHESGQRVFVKIYGIKV